MLETLASIPAIVTRLRDLSEHAEFAAESLATANGLLTAADLLPFASVVEGLHLRLQRLIGRSDALIIERVREAERLPGHWDGRKHKWRGRPAGPVVVDEDENT